MTLSLVVDIIVTAFYRFMLFLSGNGNCLDSRLTIDLLVYKKLCTCRLMHYLPNNDSFSDQSK